MTMTAIATSPFSAKKPVSPVIKGTTESRAAVRIGIVSLAKVRMTSVISPNAGMIGVIASSREGS